MDLVGLDLERVDLERSHLEVSHGPCVGGAGNPAHGPASLSSGLKTTRDVHMPSERTAIGAGADAGNDPRPRLTGVQRVWACNVVLAVIAVALTATVIARLPLPAARAAAPLWLLVIAFAAAEMLVVHLHYGRASHSFSLSEIPLVVGLYFAAPLALVAMRVLGSGYALWAHRRQSNIKLCFNLAYLLLETSVALLVWHAVLRGADPFGPIGWLAVLATVAAVDVLGAVAVTAVISLMEGRAQRQMFTRVLVSGGVAAAANASFGILVVTVLAVDWRAGWTLLVIGATLALAYRAYSTLRKKHESMEFLYGFTRSIGEALDVESVATTILDQALRMLRAEVAEVVLRGGGDRQPLRMALRGQAPVEIDRAGGMGLAALCGTSDRLERPVLIPRSAKSGRRGRLEEHGIRDLMVTPLFADGRCVGTILVANRLDDVSTFDVHDLQLLETIANHASMSLQNSRLVDRLRLQATENEHQALHDALTGLPNRTLFHERVRAAAASGGGAAVMLMDLDRFKEVNDTLGHHTGDFLLQEVGRRLSAAVRRDATIARLGGDEFAILLPGVTELCDARSAAARLCAALDAPFTLRGLSLGVCASVGIAVCPQHGEDPELLLQHADVAMYAAKASHGGPEVYAAERDQYSPRRFALMAALPHAIAADELTLHYQPKVELRTGQVLGVEALVRWYHAEHGLIGPDEFIPIAEHTGLITPLTHFVLRRALDQCRAWREGGTAVGVAVNVSARSLLDAAFPDVVAELLETARCPAGALTLEITESSMMADPVRTMDVLVRLSAMGVGLSIDDFGTGYSSLSRLKRLPVDEIKIDRSFVQSMALDPDDAAIVQSTIDLGRNLRLRVVAEGVEDQATFERLRELGCDAAQGYWISRPLAAYQIEEWLRERRAGRRRTDAVVPHADDFTTALSRIGRAGSAA
ncbi:EAL domain-containing protein [soil metagenome]